MAVKFLPWFGPSLLANGLGFGSFGLKVAKILVLAD
jgi:hypothetical protein